MWPGEKKLKDIKVDRSDVRSMRKALREMEHHKAHVRAVADTARYHGLSGEDEYTVLAYELLLQNEELHDVAIGFANRTLDKFIVIQPGDIRPAPVPDNTAEDALMDIWRRANTYKFDGKTGRQVIEEALLKLGRIRKVGDRYEEVPCT